MLDREGNIVLEEKIFFRIYNAIKENIAVLSIILPIAIGGLSIISNTYYYLGEFAYYTYFGIPEDLLFFERDNKLYLNIVEGILGIAYWFYAVFSVEVILMKKRWFLKVLLLVIIPFACIFFLLFEGKAELLSFGGVFAIMILHWIFTFCFGYCFTPWVQRDISFRRKRRPKKVIQSSELNFVTLGIFLIFFAVAFLFWTGYQENTNLAKEQRTFGIVRIDNTAFAVIDASEEFLILKACEPNENRLVIKKDTYYRKENNLPVCFQTFKNVDVE